MSIPVTHGSNHKIIHATKVVLWLSCLANEKNCVYVCVPRWEHGLLENTVYDQMWSIPSASTVFINSQNEHPHLAKLSLLQSQLAFIAARLRVDDGDFNFTSHLHPFFLSFSTHFLYPDSLTDALTFSHCTFSFSPPFCFLLSPLFFPIKSWLQEQLQLKRIITSLWLEFMHDESQQAVIE